MTSMAAAPFVPQLSLIASIFWQLSQVIIILGSFSYFFVCHAVWYIYAWLYCFYVMNLLWKVVLQVCIVFLHYIDKYMALFFATCVTSLLCPLNCYQQFVICYHTDFAGETVVVECFLAME